MLIGRIEGANLDLGKPADWDDAKGVACGETILSSAWFPTPDELALLNAGRPVYLHIFGRGHPPVSLTVEVAP